MNQAKEIAPFLKWAGGKRWFVQDHFHLFPKRFRSYYEPFLGSAAVYFFLAPKRAVLSDINGELINAYTALRKRPDLVWRYLRVHDQNHSKSYFYDVRATVPRSEFARASRTIYLNRTCWNALYRVNRNGDFNVPIGSKKSALLPSDDFRQTAEVLQNADLRVCDFDVTIGAAGKGDFVFVDPPYTVNHNLNGFLKYNEKIFSWQDQLRLRDSVENATIRGAKVLITNADHSTVRKLYRGFSKERVSRSSVIAASSEYRGLQSELVIQCWR